MSDDESIRTAGSGASSAQLLSGYEPRFAAGRDGVHRLMLAILEDALAVFVKSMAGGAVTITDARAARAWLDSRDRSLPFTFECICDVLGFDSGYIRRGVRSLRTRPAEAAARLSLRHHVPPGPRPETVHATAAQVSVMNVAPAERASDSQRAG